MKIIGVNSGFGGDAEDYVVTLTPRELCAVFDHRYGSEEYRRLHRLKRGDEVNLADGERFRDQIANMLGKLEELDASHAKFRELMLSWLKATRQASQERS